MRIDLSTTGYFYYWHFHIFLNQRVLLSIGGMRILDIQENEKFNYLPNGQ